LVAVRAAPRHLNKADVCRRPGDPEELRQRPARGRRRAASAAGTARPMWTVKRSSRRSSVKIDPLSHISRNSKQHINMMLNMMRRCLKQPDRCQKMPIFFEGRDEWGSCPAPPPEAVGCAQSSPMDGTTRPPQCNVISESVSCHIGTCTVSPRKASLEV
jgi:hypothetical protein